MWISVNNSQNRCSQFPTLFPLCSRIARIPVQITARCLPRREQQREYAVERALSFFGREAYRTPLNFVSLENLEEEVKAAYLRVSRSKTWTFDVGNEDPLGEKESSSELHNVWQRIKHLRTLSIPQTSLTDEFRNALSQCGDDEYFIPIPWWDYEQFRRVRRLWSEYLRSDLDWDSDTTALLKGMFNSAF